MASKTLAVIDSALAACLQEQDETLFVDMQLHQTVLTLCRRQSGEISIVDQEVFPDLGHMQIQNSTARHISKLLIDSARYDPLHAPENEQAIYDQIPDWLTRLRWEPEVSAVIYSEHGELPFILQNKGIRALLNERLVNIRSFIARHPGCRLLLSHTSGLLGGLSDEFAEADVARQAAGMENVRSHQELVLQQVKGLYRVQNLKVDHPGAHPARSDGKLATHVLYQDHALPLCRPVSVRVFDEGIELSGKLDKEAALTVVLRNRTLEAIHSNSDLETLLPQSCHPGDSIMIGGHQLRLIEVENG